MRRRFLIALVLLLVLTACTSLVACGGDINPPEVYEQLHSEDASIATGANLRIMSYNVLVAAWANKDKYALNKSKFTASRAEQVKYMFYHYQPDVIGMQEMCEKWHMNLPGSIKEHYACIFNGLFDYTSMIYNIDTLELLDKGRIKYDERTESKMRNASWGLFKRKSDSKQFIVLSTHFDFGKNREKQISQMKQYNEIATELQTKYNVPMFLTGDYNVCERKTVKGDWNYDATPGDDLYRDFVGYANFTDAAYIEGIEHVDGTIVKWNDPKWDHIFVSDDVDVKRFGVLSNEYYRPISDHFAIYVDVAI